jgi:non-ribosomal peptide synthetase component F
LDDNQTANMARTFRHVLPQVISRPHTHLGDLKLITETEKACLRRWNPAIPPLPGTCVHDAILKNCVIHSNRLAVSAWDGEFTYHELDNLSFILAVHLHAMDLPRGTIVPLFFEKSKWAIVAVLGTLRSGAAYVFVDPASSHARTISTCEDINAHVMLCSTTHLSKAMELVPQAIAVETLVQSKVTLTDAAKTQLPSIKVEDPVYAVFTSGSTGRPKGVVIEHSGFFQRAMANWPALYYRASPEYFSSLALSLMSQIVISCIPCYLGAAFAFRRSPNVPTASSNLSIR